MNSLSAFCSRQRPLLRVLFSALAITCIAGCSNKAYGRFSELSGGTTDLHGATVQLAVPEEIQSEYPRVFARLTNTLGEPKSANPPKILVSLSQADAKARAGQFRLEVDDEKKIARLTAHDTAGVLNGTNTLVRLLSDTKNRLPSGSMVDWPDHSLRGLHIPLPDLKPAMVRRVIDLASLHNYNLLILQVADAVKLQSAATPPRHNALTSKQFSELANYARESGLRVVPEVKLLTHQEKFFGDSRPELMFNRVTYDPRKPEVYELVFEHLDEVLALTGSTAVHIGHDEVKGFYPRHREKWLNPGDETLPADLYVQDVRKLHEYLQGKGIEVWMWGDMLLPKDEFPSMHQRDLHGEDDYQGIRASIPRDITIFDWHYDDRQAEFPSVDAFRKDGFTVVGSTWSNPATVQNFSRYMADLRPPEPGMLATVWFHLRRREWDKAEAIITQSAAAYWNSNPGSEAPRL